MNEKPSREEQRAQAHEVEKGDWRWIMGDRRGRRIIAEILEAAQVDEVVFNGNSRDAFALGRRSVGVEIIRRAKDYAHDDFLTMLKEQHDG